jgi:MFS family permease
MLGYMGLVIGDISSGTLSQYLKSRKKVVYIFLAMAALFMATYFVCLPYMNLAGFYVICFLLGFSCGYWAIFITVAAEQFGTNIRATVATTVPNFVRGAFVLISSADMYITSLLQSVYLSGIVLGAICLIIAFASIIFLRETFGKDMNYTE